MVKKEIGTCTILDHNDKDMICEYQKCGSIKKIISSGMYMVEHAKKYYHGNCAKQLSIEFKVPIPKKRKKEE